MEKIISLDDFPNIPLLFGNYNKNIKRMREAFHVRIVARDNLKIYGEPKDVENLCMAVEEIKNKILKNGTISPMQVEEIIYKFTDHKPVTKKTDASTSVFHDHESVGVMARTPGQKKYMQSIRENEIVFGIGPSGTGKTFLAVTMALEALRQERVKKLILVRPAVEAGEKLGYLPGDFQAKINPYLRPLYDSLYNLLDYTTLKHYMSKGIVEIAPLAYMRGRTLESAFIILDEAQNTTESQMKMFLTRLGIHSRIVVTGDVTQIDLGINENSGLLHAQKILHNISGICFYYLTKDDIVRHRLVQKIVEAYEKENA